MNLAEQCIEQGFSQLENCGDGYHRSYFEEAALELGGVLVWSSNDLAGTSGQSWSPTEVYKFADGSQAEIAYQSARVFTSEVPAA